LIIANVQFKGEETVRLQHKEEEFRARVDSELSLIKNMLHFYSSRQQLKELAC
jgi:hypothetical protein